MSEREIDVLRDSDVVVVGGGIAGLVSAWEHARAGRRVVLLEAGPHLGGAVSRHVVDSLELDAGAESFAVATAAVTDLIDALGLTARVVYPNPAGAWVRHRSGTSRLPPGGLLGIPARPWSADVRAVIGVSGALRAQLDAVLPAGVGAGRTTLGGLVRARMGRRVVGRLVEPVAGGVYSADPDTLELASVNPRLLPAVREHRSLAAAVRALRAGGTRPGSAVGGLDGGLAGLVDALARAISQAGGELLTGVAVDGLEQLPGGGFVVRAGESRWRADSVVVATPGPVTGMLLAGVGPIDDGGSAVFAAGRDEVVLVTLVVRSPALETAPRGTGVLVSARARGVQAKALTHATAKWEWLARAAGPGRHVLRLSYGRPGSPAPAAADLPELARRDAGELLGVQLTRDQVLDVAVRPWSSALPRPGLGHASAVAALRAALPAGVRVVGAPVAGTGLAAVITDARQQAHTGLGPVAHGGEGRMEP